MEKLKILDLFSGIGGFSIGLEKAGMETIMFCDNNKSCRKKLRKNWPDIPIWDDVKTLSGAMLEHKKIDILCGGFPCQDISVAGHKKGFENEEGILSGFEQEFERSFRRHHGFTSGTREDISKLCKKISRASRYTKAEETRSGLWKEYLRIIKEVEPRYAIIENVANLRSSGLVKVIQDLWKIGYACEWHIISARSVGAPHLRERIWIIAYPNSSELREQSGGSVREIGKSKTLAREYGEARNTSVTDSKGLQGQRVTRGIQKEHTTVNSTHDKPTNANNFRLWKPFASEKEKQEWWTRAASSVSHWKEAQSIVCGVDDGVSRMLDRATRMGPKAERIRKRVRAIRAEIERARKDAIEQLGNAVVPQIPEMIGRAIMEYENEKK